MNHALELDNGVTMPALGFGVFQTPPDETVTAVETALRTGYRHIDTAAAYLNEREVGEAIRRSGLRARHRRARRPRSGLDHARDLRAHHPRGVNATRHPLDDGYSPSAISLIAARRRSHSAPMASSRRAVALSSAPTTR